MCYTSGLCGVSGVLYKWTVWCEWCAIQVDCGVLYKWTVVCYTSGLVHGWEIAVILRNFRKTKLSKSKFLFYFFLLCFNMYTMCDSMTFALRHTQISLYGTSARQAAIFFCTRMIQTPYKHGVPSAEPGIRRGNEDSRGNENRKSRKNKLTSILFFLNSPSV